MLVTLENDWWRIKFIIEMQKRIVSNEESSEINRIRFENWMWNECMTYTHKKSRENIENFTKTFYFKFIWLN